MTAKISVAVADGQPLYRAALAGAIDSHPDFELIAATDDGREAVAALSSASPAVAVVDPGLPNVLGHNGTRHGATKLLFCGSSTDPGEIYDYLAEGAGGYVGKAAEADEICDAIAAVAQGRTFVSPELEQQVLGQIAIRATERASEGDLTRRELDVLRALADGVAAPVIAKRLGIEPSTVKTHLKSIYAKLEVASQTAAVAEALRRGLVD